MNDPHFPLSADEDLTPETLQVLAALPPLNIFRALAALPASLRPFLELGGSILAGTHLTPKERELAILRVARLTAASHERQQHEQLARAVGITEAEIEATAGSLISCAQEAATSSSRLSSSEQRLACGEP